ncbi:MAG: hypothetical protein MJZ76_03705 [Bacteroidales bacterium]|nr:hypothetical protein [Bacteroidales bacterium]
MEDALLLQPNFEVKNLDLKKEIAAAILEYKEKKGSRLTLEEKEDIALGILSQYQETGELVDEETIMNLLKV